jgi:hypothetical protein
VESAEGGEDGLLWERNGLVVECFRWGAVNELDLKEKVESCRSHGWPQVAQGADSADLETGLNSSNSASHLEQ